MLLVYLKVNRLSVNLKKQHIFVVFGFAKNLDSIEMFLGSSVVDRKPSAFGCHR